MIKLNKILILPRFECNTSLDLKIANAVQKVVKFDVFYVKYKEVNAPTLPDGVLKPERAYRRFLIEEVYGLEDKVSGKLDMLGQPKPKPPAPRKVKWGRV